MPGVLYNDNAVRRMRLGWGVLLIALAAWTPACNRDPNLVKRKYLESGNRYFERGKYREASIMYRSALRKDARYGEAYYRLGLTSLKLKQPGMALRQFHRAFELLPEGPLRAETSNRLADLYLAQFLLDTRRESPIRDELASLLKNPRLTAFDRLRLEAHVAWKDGGLDEAIEKFRQADRLRPHDPPLILALAQALMAKGETLLPQRGPEAAKPWFEEAVRISKDVIERNRGFAPMYDVLYGHYMRQGLLSEADQIRQLKVNNNPKNADFRLQLATHYLQTNRPGQAQQVIDALLADRETFPDGRDRAGDFYMLHQQFDKAIEYYRAGLGGGGEEWLHFQRKIADALVAQGKRDQAAALLDQEILKRFPRDPVAQALRASLRLESGSAAQVQQAVSELQESARKLPNNPVVRYNLGRALFLRGDLEQAQIQFEASAKLQADYLPPRLALCELHLRRREYAAALALADRILAQAPEEFTARMLRSQALEGLGRTEEARASILEAGRMSASTPAPLISLGLLEINSRRFDAAAKVFQQCLSRFPGQPLCTLGLAEAYTGQSEFSKAQALLEAELERNPSRRDLRLALSNVHTLGGRYDAAIGILKAMAAAEPNSADLQIRLGETHRLKGDLRAAIEHFRRARQLQPDNADVHVWLALLLHMTGRADEARQHYQDILRLQPDNAIALNNLAYVMAENGGDLELALTYAQRARLKLPGVPEVADTLGWIYIKKQLTANALTIYDELVAKYPTNPIYRYHRGMALLQKGDRAEARKELEAALRNRPEPEDRAKIEDLMRRIG